MIFSPSRQAPRSVGGKLGARMTRPFHMLDFFFACSYLCCRKLSVNPTSCLPPLSLCRCRSVIVRQVANAITVGALLVATHRMSIDRVPPGLPLPLQALIKMKQAHWRHSVYLIYAIVEGDAADGSDSILALNLTRPCSVTDDEAAAIRVVHHNGGAPPPPPGLG